MNKIFRTTLVLSMATLMVTSCDFIQYKQVEYDEWHEAVSNLPDSPKASKIKVKGKAEDKVIDIVLKDGTDEDDFSSEEIGVIILLAFMSGTGLASIDESANGKYYIGQFGLEGYKYEDVDDSGKHIVKWDKYGNVTSYEDKSVTFTAAYTYEGK